MVFYCICHFRCVFLFVMRRNFWEKNIFCLSRELAMSLFFFLSKVYLFHFSTPLPFLVSCQWFHLGRLLKWLRAKWSKFRLTDRFEWLRFESFCFDSWLFLSLFFFSPLFVPFFYSGSLSLLFFYFSLAVLLFVIVHNLKGKNPCIVIVKFWK